MKPRSTIWPSSSTTCTGKRWRFSTLWCEGLGRIVAADSTMLLGIWQLACLLRRWEKMELPWHFRYVMAALNKMRKRRSSRSSRSWLGGAGSVLRFDCWLQSTPGTFLRTVAALPPLVGCCLLEWGSHPA